MTILRGDNIIENTRIKMSKSITVLNNALYIDLTRFDKISIQGTRQMAVEREAINLYWNCGIRHVTVPLATRILIANVRHIGVSNICVINLVYFKMQV